MDLDFDPDDLFPMPKTLGASIERPAKVSHRVESTRLIDRPLALYAEAPLPGRRSQISVRAEPRTERKMRWRRPPRWK